MSKKRYEWVFENGENEIIDNLAGRYVTISSPELLNEKDEKISDLEAKLAEKDELIGTLKNKYECADRELYLTKDTLKHHTNIYNSLFESRHQDKISFAVEKLTEIRDYVKNCWSLDTTEGKVRLDIAKKIRLKIEELKGNENE